MAAGQLAPSSLRRPNVLLSGLPVFLYHGLTEDPKAGIPWREAKYWVSREQFSGHLQEVRRQGRHPLLIEQAWEPSAEPDDCRKTVVLTFDDGRASDYRIAFPLLVAAGAPANFFLNISTIGRPGYLHWTEIEEMQRAGMSFQSHSHDHVDLSRLSARELEKQLAGSKRLLEDRLGRRVEYLAVPYGRLNPCIIQAAQDAGYRAVCNSRSWPAQAGAPTINRIAVYAHTTRQAFGRLLAGNPVSFAGRSLRAMALCLPKELALVVFPNHFRAGEPEEKA